MLDRNFVLNLSQRSTDINEYLMTVYNLPVQLDAKVIVELGAGQSTFTLTAAANKTGGEFYSIDMGEGASLRSYPEGAGILAQEPRYHFILGDDLEIVKTWDKEIDFLLFDTSHLYEATVAEIDAWFPKVRVGGQIFMHDTNHEAGLSMGCRRALNEWLATDEGKKYSVVHLLDTKIIGASVLNKLSA